MAPLLANTVIITDGAPYVEGTDPNQSQNRQRTKSSLVGIDDLGNITLPALATVDGRDVSVDGAKLDLITVTGAVDLDTLESDVALNSLKVSFPEAPIDGSPYARKDGAWAVVAVGGDVVGPISAVDSRIAAFDGITGNLIKDGGRTIAEVIARANHTGTQVAATISDFDAEVTNNAAVVLNTAKVTNAIHTGDATGGTALTISPNVVDNLKLSDVPTATFKGRATAGTGNPEDLTAAQARSVLGVQEATPGADGSIPKWDASPALVDSGLTANGLTTSIIGTPFYSTLADAHNVLESAGVAIGGELTDNGDGTIAVSQIDFLIRATDDDTAPLLWGRLPTVPALALTDGVLSHIYVEYNAGVPQIVADVADRADNNTNVHLSHVFREGIIAHITPGSESKVSNSNFLTVDRLISTEPFIRNQENPGGIIGETGIRNLTITPGGWWHGLTPFTTAAFDSSALDRFISYYQDGLGGFTRILSQSQIDNLSYDNLSGVLGTLGSNNYGTRWVYLGQDGDVYHVFGLTNSPNLTVAQDEDPLATVPPHFGGFHARLLGKIIVRKAVDPFISIQSAFNGQFSLQTATDHGALVGLEDVADHAYAFLHDGTRAMTGNLDVGTFNIINVGTIDGRDVSVDGAKLDLLTLTQAVDLDQMEIDVAANNAKITNATHTGDVTGSGFLTIANAAVDIIHLSATGTPSASNFLRGDNVWASPAGGGDVVGPVSAVDSRIAAFDGISGTLIKDGGSTIADVQSRANHTGTQLVATISDFDTEVANNAAVVLNTAKETNATHTGEVTGSTALTIANDVVTNAKAANMATQTIKGRTTAGTGDPEDLTAAQARTLLNVEDGADVTDTANVTAAGALMDSELTNLAAVKALDQGVATTDSPQFAAVNVGHASDTTLTRSAPGVLAVEGADVLTQDNEVLIIAISDETTDLTTGTAKVTFRMPFAMTLTDIKSSVTTAPVGSSLTIDVNEGGTSIMTTNKLDILTTATIDDGTAVLTDTALAADAVITIDIDTIGSTTAGAGAKVTFIGYRT
jgi:hypothetical protein